MALSYRALSDFAAVESYQDVSRQVKELDPPEKKVDWIPSVNKRVS